MWMDLLIFVLAFGAGFCVATGLERLKQHREQLAKEEAAMERAIKRASKPRKPKVVAAPIVSNADVDGSLYGRPEGNGTWPQNS